MYLRVGGQISWKLPGLLVRYMQTAAYGRKEAERIVGVLATNYALMQLNR
jgi:hypothetical protein